MEFTLKVSDKDVEVIGAALAELPFKSVAALVTKLQTQITEQASAESAKAADAETTDAE